MLENKEDFLLTHKMTIANLDYMHRVFEEMGYDLIDDCIISNASGQVKKDYHEFGDDSLINVTMSDKGQMLFEVVGDGTETGMGDSRAEKMEPEIKRFCPSYGRLHKCNTVI